MFVPLHCIVNMKHFSHSKFKLLRKNGVNIFLDVTYHDRIVKSPCHRQIIIIDSTSSPCIYLSLYLETDNRRKYLLSFWESALADEIRADLITGNVNAR